jgi:hypothetical protein
MAQLMQPHELVSIKKEVVTLINTYKSVNDRNVVAVMQTDAINRIKAVLPENDITRGFLETIADRTLTKARAAEAFVALRQFVAPFPELSVSQLNKLFRKVKKLPNPNWSELDQTQMTYLGWNDTGSQKKYIVASKDDKLVGIYGDFDPQPLNGLCAICHQISSVSMFLSTVKTSGADGNYTKRGNLICRDSSLCNAQLTDPSYLAAFVNSTYAR